MSAKRLRLITFSGLALIVLVLALGVALLRLNRLSVRYALPDRQSVLSPAPGGKPAGEGEAVAVTRENVRAVVAALERPKAYARTIHVRLYYGTGFAEYTIESAVGENASYASISGPGGRRFVLTAGESRYIWYEGDKEYFTADAKSSDEDAMILTYEDIVALDEDAIQDAGTVRHNGELCIFVEYTLGELGYKTRCYVSATSGLLVEAEQYDGERLVYTMTSSDLSLSAPDESVFALPDGTNPAAIR